MVGLYLMDGMNFSGGMNKHFTNEPLNTDKGNYNGTLINNNCKNISWCNVVLYIGLVSS